MKKRRRFPAEKKAQIVLEVLREDSTLAEVANEGRNNGDGSFC